MAYLDSNVFIYPILYSEEIEPKAKTALDLLRKVASGELSAYTSTITWDEVIWVVRKAMGKSEAENQGQKLLGFQNLKFVCIDENILCQAQALLKKYNLRPHDAIHVASAIDKKIYDVISDDKDLDQVKEIKRIPLG
jgi:predicted nucleic acid-binding protein